MNRLNKYFNNEVHMEKLSTYDVLKALQAIKEINSEYWLTHSISEENDAAFALARIGIIIEKTLNGDLSNE